MKSNTKNRLTEEQIKNLVRIHFGDRSRVGNIIELEGGMFNSAYLIERLEEKDKIVLKVSLAPGTTTLSYEKDPMPTEIEVYRMIEEKTTIPTPRILTYDFSKKHIASNYFFMTALEGTVMFTVLQDIPEENLMELKTELAGYFAQLHQNKGEYFGYFTDDEMYRFKAWKDAFLHMMKMILEDGKTHGSDLPYTRIESVLNEKAIYLEAVLKPVLVDFDLWPGNIFLVQKNGKYVIEGIIDFERAFWGDPLADFTSVMLIAHELHHDPVLWDTYKNKAKYGRELSKEDDIRFALYSLYIYTIMVVETFRYEEEYKDFQLKYSNNFLYKYLKELEDS